MARMRPRPRSERYPNQGQPWTKNEEETIMNSDLLDKELSEVLGRTESSIHNHRHLMYKNETKLEEI